jgi:hypothetical protein
MSGIFATYRKITVIIVPFFFLFFSSPPPSRYRMSRAYPDASSVLPRRVSRPIIAPIVEITADSSLEVKCRARIEPGIEGC